MQCKICEKPLPLNRPRLRACPGDCQLQAKRNIDLERKRKKRKEERRLREAIKTITASSNKMFTDDLINHLKNEFRFEIDHDLMNISTAFSDRYPRNIFDEEDIRRIVRKELLKFLLLDKKGGFKKNSFI